MSQRHRLVSKVLTLDMEAGVGSIPNILYVFSSLYQDYVGVGGKEQREREMEGR